MTTPVSTGAPTGAGRPLDAPAPTRPADRLDAATRDFEAVLFQEMLKAMRDTVPDGGLLDGGHAREVFTTMLDEHVAGEAARRGQNGLASALYRQFVDRVTP
jgi:Rod binding domain-containing protein